MKTMFIAPQIEKYIKDAIARGSEDSVLVMNPKSAKNHLIDCYRALEAKGHNIPPMYLDEKVDSGLIVMIPKSILLASYPGARLAE